MTRRGPRRSRGFTLIEMMIVVAIVGILAALAGVYLRRRVTPYDVANRVAGLLQQGLQRAVAGGPVRADVAIALNSKARAKILATGGTQPTFTLYVLQEDPLPASSGQWVPVLSYTVPADVTADSWSTEVGAYGAVSKSSDFTTLTIMCEPSGICDTRTLFLTSDLGPTRERFVHISMLPLGGAVYIRPDWN